MPISQDNYGVTDDQESESVTDKVAKLPWIEKYRPQSLQDVVSHRAVIYQALAYVKNRDFPHMLFHGK